MGCTMRLVLLLLVGAGSSRAVDNGVGNVPIMGFDAWSAFSPYSSGPCGGTYHNAPGAFNYSRALTETAKVMVSGGYRDAGYRVVPATAALRSSEAPAVSIAWIPGPGLAGCTRSKPLVTGCTKKWGSSSAGTQRAATTPAAGE
jgi:hypothetical protein